MSYQPRFASMVALLDESVSNYGPKPLFGTRRAGGWEWTTFAEFGVLVSRARRGLSRLGVGPGDRVAVISNNRIEWVAAAHATYGLGAAYVAMYESQVDKEWEYILTDSGAKACFVANRKIFDRVAKFKERCPALEHLIVFDTEAGTPGFADVLAGDGETPAVSPRPDDVACLIYTSGTTGNPKGVRLTHHNLAANVSAILDVAPLRENDRSLAFLPWAHVFGGCVELNGAIATGSSVAICDDTTKLIDYLPEVRPTMLYAVPRIWNRIYESVGKQMAGRPAFVKAIFRQGVAARMKQKRGEALTVGERIALPLAEKLIFSKISARFGGRLKFAFSGAAALSREVAEFIDALGIDVYEGYGMTESSGCTTTNRPGVSRIGSVGKPVPGVEVKLDPSATGAGPGEGEILIYGTGVMAGYHGLPDATRDAVTPDGALRSGDLGRFDKDGFLYITGRVKELFKLSNGKYVAPALLEEQLQLSPFIAQCVVYGEDRPHNVALIVPDRESLESWAKTRGLGGAAADLLSDARTRELYVAELEKYGREFKGYERIRSFFFELEPLTTDNGMLTPTLKLKRRGVVKKYEGQFAALY